MLYPTHPFSLSLSLCLDAAINCNTSRIRNTYHLFPLNLVRLTVTTRYRTNTQWHQNSGPWRQSRKYILLAQITVSIYQQDTDAALGCSVWLTYIRAHVLLLITLLSNSPMGRDDDSWRDSSKGNVSIHPSIPVYKESWNRSQVIIPHLGTVLYSKQRSFRNNSFNVSSVSFGKDVIWSKFIWWRFLRGVW